MMKPSMDSEAIYEVLTQLSMALGVPLEKSDVSIGHHPSEDDSDPLNSLIDGANQIGLVLRENLDTRSGEVIAIAREGVPVVVTCQDDQLWTLSRAGRRIEVTDIAGSTPQASLRYGQARRFLDGIEGPRIFIAKKELECDSMSTVSSHGTHGDAHHDHATPLSRFLALLRLDSRDIVLVAIFALVSGILSLATPLAIESLVNVVSWGSYWQPLIVLAVMLLACLGLSAVLNVLQTVVVEVIQRRQLVRIVGDLAHRFPRANRESLHGAYPREMANRLFDIMTIQKATAILMFDGVSIVLSTVLGLLLLAFYHPFLLGFDLVLLFTMVLFTWLLGRNGIKSAINESISKYEIVHWLQDVLASPTAFKVNGGETLAIDRANHLAANYVEARQEQFRVVLRQVIFAVTVQVIASTVLLGLGGWLVIRGQLTLGQLVASELVVTVVVGAFAKAGKSIEKFYDLMAGIDKVGHLLDIEVDPKRVDFELPEGAATVRWSDLTLNAGSGTKIAGVKIAGGSTVSVTGASQHVRSQLALALAGLSKPASGFIELAGLDAESASISSNGRLVGYAGKPEVFHGTVRENVFLGREFVGRTKTRESLLKVGLWGRVMEMPGGLEASLQTAGYPLNEEEIAKLMIARAIAGQPRLLIIDGLLDQISSEARMKIWEAIVGASDSDERPWTLIVTTECKDLIERCDDRLTIQ